MALPGSTRAGTIVLFDAVSIVWTATIPDEAESVIDELGEAPTRYGQSSDRSGGGEELTIGESRELIEPRPRRCRRDFTSSGRSWSTLLTAGHTFRRRCRRWGHGRTIREDRLFSSPNRSHTGQQCRTSPERSRGGRRQSGQ